MRKHDEPIGTPVPSPGDQAGRRRPKAAPNASKLDKTPGRARKGGGAGTSGSAAPPAPSRPKAAPLVPAGAAPAAPTPSPTPAPAPPDEWTPIRVAAAVIVACAQALADAADGEGEPREKLARLHELHEKVFQALYELDRRLDASPHAEAPTDWAVPRELEPVLQALAASFAAAVSPVAGFADPNAVRVLTYRYLWFVARLRLWLAGLPAGVPGEPT
jgi:hypothetical protein